ncbi:MAG: iron ABC transporter permease [Halothiobacillaceae bacterium]|nr:iron ABC transporter permease [Halothiobacillaceae bacterium]
MSEAIAAGAPPLAVLSRPRAPLALPLLAGGLLLSLLASAMTGPVALPPAQVAGILAAQFGIETGITYTPMQAGVLMEVRLPRLVLAVLVGFGMALAGAAMQGLFRNPLADPGIVGVSSGAALGAVGWIVLAGQIPLLGALGGWLGAYALPAFAFLGGLLTTLVIYRLAGIGRPEAQTFMLLLAGVAISALTGAATGLLTYIANDEQLRSITFWTMGSLGNAGWEQIPVLLLLMLPTTLGLFALYRLLDALLLGETVAGHLGFDMRRARPLLVVLTALMVGTAVSMTGIIGFIGLMAPHIARLIVGPGHRRLLPAAALIGALLLVVGDMVARTLASPAEIPIGILTALVGGPFFLFLLLSRRVGP